MGWQSSTVGGTSKVWVVGFVRLPKRRACMGKIRRGGYILIDWVGDHSPRHVHVYRDGSLVCKWDLDRSCIMEGAANKKVRTIIGALVEEGQL